MDEYALDEFLDMEDATYITMEDDTIDRSFMLNKSQIVGIKWEELT
jgi:hypothetical protein